MSKNSRRKKNRLETSIFSSWLHHSAAVVKMKILFSSRWHLHHSQSAVTFVFALRLGSMAQTCSRSIRIVNKFSNYIRPTREYGRHHRNVGTWAMGHGIIHRHSRRRRLRERIDGLMRMMSIIMCAAASIAASHHCHEGFF